jgi:hypothetical protein
VPRIGDAELKSLRLHLRQHPSARWSASDTAGVEATLKSFAVTPEVAA